MFDKCENYFVAIFFLKKYIFILSVVEVLNWSQEWNGLLFNYSDVPTNADYIFRKNLNVQAAATLF